jgi:hypothetical protein
MWTFVTKCFAFLEVRIEEDVQKIYTDSVILIFEAGQHLSQRPHAPHVRYGICSAKCDNFSVASTVSRLYK